MELSVQMKLGTATDVVDGAQRLGMKLPKTITTAFERVAVVEDVGRAEPVEVDLASVATADLAAHVEAIADRRVRRGAVGVARGEVGQRLAVIAINAVRAAGPGILDELRPSFDDAAARFIAAFADAPPNYADAAALAEASFEQLAAFRNARETAVVLDELAMVRDKLADLGVVARGDRVLEAATRYCSPPDVVVARRIGVMRRRDCGVLGRWGDLLDRGVTLTWPTIAEQEATIAALVEAEAHALREEQQRLANDRHGARAIR